MYQIDPFKFFQAYVNKLFCVSLLAAMLSSPAAQAAQPFYVGATLGLNNSSANISNGVETLESPDNPRPLGFQLGYTIHRNFAIEAGYTNIGQYDFSNGGELDLSVMHLALKGTAQFSQNWAMVAKIGAARHQMDLSIPNMSGIKDNKTLRMLALGVEYRISDQWSGSLTLADYGTSREPGFNISARQIELGAQYKF